MKSEYILCRNFCSGNDFITTPLINGLSESPHRLIMRDHETNLPTFTQEAPQETRLPPPIENGRRKTGSPKKKKERPKTSGSSLIEGPHLLLWVLPSNRPGDRRILITRRLIPFATERNGWRRRIREILRNKDPLIVPGVALRIKVHSRGKTRPRFAELEKELLGLLQRSGSLR